MAQHRGNQFRGKGKKSKKKRNIFAGIISFFKNEQIHKVVGVSFLLIAAYLFIAFTSFLFTWQVDQDKVLGSWTALLLSEDSVDNWLGKIGAITAHQFIHVWFGVASYIFVLLFFISGFRILFKVALLPLTKTFKYSFFALIWLAATLGYFFDTKYFYLGGGIGYSTSNFLNSVVGSIGNLLLILFSLLIFCIFTFKLSFDWFKKIPEIIDKEDDFDVVAENKIVETEEEIEVEDENDELTEEEESEAIELSTDKVLAEEEDNEEDNEEELIDDNFSVEKAKSTDEELTQEEIDENEKLHAEDYDPTLDLSDYQHPHIDLLEQHGSNQINVNKDELTENKNRIVETLGNYNIQIDKIKATIGPTVTLYELIPAAGVRISKIKNLEDDIALSLSALGIRIIAPIPGKGTIGIEVPNLNPEVVSMRSIIASDKFQNSNMELPIGLGKTISNETFVADLAKMPHLLMAGATGQGKSVGLNAILTSLVYKKHPSQLKLVLVDPKKVELTLFNKIENHFLAKLPDSEEAIITDTKKVVHTLNSLCIEMDQRYDLLKEAEVRNIKEYNTKFIARKLNPNKGSHGGHKFLPYIVLVVDEFADLIMTAGKEVEAPIARLAQLARAIGIHLIIATQRPSVNIITGTIKANFPARIAFRVTSKIDSRTILDSGGADQLIGRGDMLLSTGSDLIRIQCAFVDTPEVENITKFIGDQRGYPETYTLPEFVDESTGGGGGELNADERDALFADAARIIVQHQQGSASLLQRRLKLGYNRAGRIIDQLEDAGIIGSFEGSKAREVLIKDPATLEQLLTDLP